MPLDGTKYLGQIQNEVEIPPELVAKQKQAWDDLYADVRTGEYDANDPAHSGVLPPHRTAAETRRIAETLQELPTNDPAFEIDPGGTGIIRKQVYKKSSPKTRGASPKDANKNGKSKTSAPGINKIRRMSSMSMLLITLPTYVLLRALRYISR